jgi:hypothetical protein
MNFVISVTARAKLVPQYQQRFNGLSGMNARFTERS